MSISDATDQHLSLTQETIEKVDPIIESNGQQRTGH
jgi:ferritin-like metal-binding protein YciE